MRLIDAYALMNSVKRQTSFVRLIGGDFEEIADVLEKGILQEIENAPTIEERKTGKWIDVEHAPNELWYATCSACGERQTVEVANYCQICGADMRGREDDEAD